MSGCVFCAIVAGDAPASFVYEDDLAVAFLDINPVTPGHTLVVPRRHLPYLADLDEATGMHVHRIAMQVAGALRAAPLRCEGVNMFVADGEAAFQEVFHHHLHVFPRYRGDGFRIAAEGWSAVPDRAELDANAALLKEAMP